MSPFGELIEIAMGAVSALRSYQHGNSAPDLAEEVADALQNAIRNALGERDADLTKLSGEINQQLSRLGELVQVTSVPRTRQQIEDLLLHYKDGHCASSPEQVAAAIGVLEWVLGRNKDLNAGTTQ